jgi:hypothetical protein
LIFDCAFFYQYFVPDGTDGIFGYAFFYRYVVPDGTGGFLIMPFSTNISSLTGLIGFD